MTSKNDLVDRLSATELRREGCLWPLVEWRLQKISLIRLISEQSSFNLMLNLVGGQGEVSGVFFEISMVKGGLRIFNCGDSNCLQVLGTF